MNPHDPEGPPDDALKKALGALEYSAMGLDARRYPGQAWPAPRVVVRSRGGWKFAASIAGLAALIAVAFHFAQAPLRHVRSVASRSISQTRGMAPARTTPVEQDALPRIVIVEDMDSYSIIDMTGAVPLVSFSRRDSDGFDDDTPAFVEPISEPATRNAPL
ncbi:MAG TPA: hypothetical protein VG326_07305 [Tepidisphaeraceae bacterium]|jgi:hypothetical protein|nr:hypothetical protein [Tepidisphaeraceae bacterium]